MLRLAYLGAACLASLAIVACGGDDDKGPSKADYVKKANALCAANDKKQAELVQTAFEDSDNPTPEEAQEFLRQGAPISKAGLADLRELEQAEGDEEELDKIYAAADRGVSVVEEASQDPDASLELLQDEEGPFEEANELARAYGLTACAD